MSKVYKCRIDPSSSGWFSEPDDEDNIENLNTSKIKHPVFNEGDSMKNRELEVCMKFPNVKVFREAITDWVVRNGYQLDHLNNESTRFTAKCLSKDCNWRIHALVVQGGPEFQV